MKTPLEAFMEWFDRVPVELRKYLAHIHMICTTDDTSHMTARPDQTLERFRIRMLKMDFPLRVSARMFYIRAVFDMVIFHYKEIVDGDNYLHLTGEKKKIVQISTKQWETILESWKELRQKEMAETYIHTWASWMIKLQMEAK